MSPNVVRLALPGYNALTDSNLDHFSLYADVDNVLIKRYLSGTDTLPDGPDYPTIHTINHDLSYIPFFMAYFASQYEAEVPGNTILNNEYDAFEVPAIVCAVDIDDLIIKNFSGGAIDYSYDIFYDDMDTAGSPSITESSNVFKVARPDKSASSKNPNDYIVHSDLNNFKILKQGTLNKTLSVGSNSFNHGASISAPYKYFCFLQFPDGKTTLLGGSASTNSYDESNSISHTLCDDTKIYIYLPYGQANITVDISYIIYGTGQDDTVSNSDVLLACAKDGQNVLTSSNPDNFNFHSDYPTLKYYNSGTYSMTVSDTTTYTIAHNLGYTPFFIGFCNDLQASFFSSSSYAILPYYLGNSAYPFQLDNDIASFIYADDTNIYLKAYYQANAVGTSKTFSFYYKIFKNNLGI